jgi:hypothetical protein
VAAAPGAFAVWALSDPTNPMQDKLGAVFAGFLAIVVSPVLTAVDAIVRALFEKLNS